MLPKVHGFKDLAACPLHIRHSIEVGIIRYTHAQQSIDNLLYIKDGQPVGPFSTIVYGPELTVDPLAKPKQQDDETGSNTRGKSLQSSSFLIRKFR